MCLSVWTDCDYLCFGGSCDYYGCELDVVVVDDYDASIGSYSVYECYGLACGVDVVVEGGRGDAG